MPGTDKNERKLHPWLRVVKNCNRTVNAVRADGSTRVACSSSREQVPVAPIYAELAQQQTSVPRWTEELQTSTARLSRRLKLPETAPGCAPRERA